jgi:hypothetical protein
MSKKKKKGKEKIRKGKKEKKRSKRVPVIKNREELRQNGHNSRKTMCRARGKNTISFRKGGK